MIEVLNLLENDEPLTNFDVVLICNKLNIPLDSVAMNNQFKFNWLSKDFSVILNLENTGKGGSHWVAFYNDVESKSIFYMDSYGEICNTIPNKHIIKKNLNLYFNKKQFQAINSIMCGWFCIYFLYIMNKYKSKVDAMIKFLEFFDYSDYDKNDIKIKQLMRTLIKSKMKNI